LALNVSSVITGVSRREQVVENMKALEAAEKIDAAIIEHIELILQYKQEPESDYR